MIAGTSHYETSLVYKIPNCYYCGEDKPVYQIVPIHDAHIVRSCAECAEKIFYGKKIRCATCDVALKNISQLDQNQVGYVKFLCHNCTLKEFKMMLKDPGCF